jgi:hypothetical protein
VKDKKIESLVEKDALNHNKIEDLLLISQKYDNLNLQNNKLVIYYVINSKLISLK